MTTLTSCSDYFDQVPDDRLSLEEIFKTRDGALKYLSNVYTFLPDEFNQRQVHETSLYRTPGHGPERVMKPNGLHQAIKPN
ncbi:hypothetical protein NXY28_15255 [Bacteroides thetaiotaomicron]|nr:hypothetical protein NXY28_15255 [Bacteroides thetaiotaomicron]